ncbi:MAG: FtsX-like permease family protein [Coriobacteriaceae bacterium]|nr:FtsX-like permease family protein [Coriobacteriaceae bacterium]
MKPTQITELFANIKKTFVSFFSILMFVALGVGIFLGISWSGPALQQAADRAFDEGNFHNFQVQFPYGLTEGDLAKLSAVEGVSQIEGARQSYQTVVVDGQKLTVKVQTLGSSIDAPLVREGELPAKANEIALHAATASSLGAGVGDTITFEKDVAETSANDASASTSTTASADAQSSQEQDGMKYLNGRTYKVTAIIDSPDYVATAEGMLGVAPTPSGTVDALAWVQDGAFDASAFQNGYPVVNVRCDGLDGKSTFSNEYKNDSATIEERIVELGSTLAKSRYDDLHGQAQKKVDEGQAKIDDAKRMIAEGEQKIADGEKQLAEGREALETKRAQAQAELDAGYWKLVDAQATYDAKLAEYNAYKNTYDSTIAEIESTKTQVNSLLAEYSKVEEDYNNHVIDKDEYEKRCADIAARANALLDPWRGEFPDLPTITADNVGLALILAAAVLDDYGDIPFEINGRTMTLNEAADELAAAEAERDSGYALLQSGWSQYYAKQSEFEGAIAQAEQKIADGEQELADAKQQVADAKQQVAQNEPQLADAQAQVDAMSKYEWSVMPRSYNIGAGQVSVFSSVTGNLSISMAALFIIVGLLVSYSAVSRIVNEQVTQIGTKKALGLRAKEITTSFLLYSGLAVLTGAIIGTIVGITLVEGIIGGVLGGMFTFGGYPPYFGLGLFLIVTLLELALILGTTWLACRGILKKHAVDLLRGPEPPKAKTRFYEKWGIWERLPLLTQTIVNNCVNDKRRVFSTVVGVAGCTALIVTAVTLNNDVMKSYDRQYNNVYGFNAIAFVNDEPADAIDQTETALENDGFTAAQAVRRSYAFKQPDGAMASARVIVPMDSGAFADVYHVNPLSGETLDLSQDGAWVTRAFANHLGVKAGDEIAMRGTDGTVHHVKVLGFYEFYLTYHEMVMGRDYFESEFGKATPNVVLANTGETAVADVESDLSAINGFDSVLDDKTFQYGNFATFSSVSSAVVAIYLALAILMAVVVLLNLNVMFIDEKKRELIVLMINGFSTKDAKRYIYNDSIVLTAIGIICGLILGCVMGSITVAAVEPSTAVFVKDIDLMAVIAGVVGSAALSVIMSVIALRRIPRFKLTDINKF